MTNMFGIDKRTGERRPVIPGEEVFKMMDSGGLPFDIMQDIMEEHKIAFDVRGFVEAALKSKNYQKPDKLIYILTRDIANDDELVERVTELVYYIYGEKQ